MAKNILISYFAFLLFIPFLEAQQTVGLFSYEEDSFDGYTLFSPLRSTTTYLIDNCGKIIHTWEGEYLPSQMSYLLEDGTLLRAVKSNQNNPVFNAGGAGERLQKVDWDGNLIWDFMYSNDTVRMHHDVEPLPNGNVLILAWEYKSKEEAITWGRDPSLIPDNAVWPEHIIEVQQTGPTSGTILWKWYLWDHLIQDFDSTKANFGVVADHSELLDINFVSDIPELGDADWLHINSIDYNETLDQIIVGSPGLNEFYIIDHSTTTAEAAGHTGGNSGKGGDILYRWGNPIAYRQGAIDDQQLFGHHDVHWISGGASDAGKIMVFNNGRDRPGGEFSSVDIIDPPVDDNGNYFYQQGTAFGPESAEWIYKADNPTEWYSSFISGAQRLPNGNTLICSGADGRFFEIATNGEIVWEYINPVTQFGPTSQGETIPPFGGLNGNIVFRCTRYSSDYPGLQNKDLTPIEPIEPNALPSSTDCSLFTSLEEPTIHNIKIYPNPAGSFIFIERLSLQPIGFQIVDLLGRVILLGKLESNNQNIDLSSLEDGIYFIKVDKQIKKLVILK